MHFEVLVEDRSGRIALDCIMEKILGANGSDHSWEIISYKGIGHIPKDLRGVTDPNKRILLESITQDTARLWAEPQRHRTSCRSRRSGRPGRPGLHGLQARTAQRIECVQPAPADAVQDCHRGKRSMVAGRPRRGEGSLSRCKGIRCWTDTCRTASAARGKCSRMRSIPAGRRGSGNQAIPLQEWPNGPKASLPIWTWTGTVRGASRCFEMA